MTLICLLVIIISIINLICKRLWPIATIGLLIAHHYTKDVTWLMVASPYIIHIIADTLVVCVCKPLLKPLKKYNDNRKHENKLAEKAYLNYLCK